MTTLTALMAALVDELEEGDVPAPLHQDFCLATVFADLARLAGEPVPAEVAAILDGPAIARQRGDAARAWVPGGQLRNGGEGPLLPSPRRGWRHD